MRQRAKRKIAYKFMGKPLMCSVKRCKSYVAGCMTCDTFKFLDTYGGFPRDFEELAAYSDKQVKGETI